MQKETSSQVQDSVADRLAWLPLPVLLTGIVVLWIVDPATSYESQFLLLLLNFLFTGLVTLCIGYLAGRSFLQNGQPGVLMLGCGALLWGTSTMVASMLVKASGNLLVTVHNLGAFGGAACHLTGLAWRGQLKRPSRWLAVAYAGVPAVVALLAWGATSGWTPVFFVQGQGGTLLRQIVLVSTIGMFALTSGIMLNIHRRHPRSFLYWYGLGLALIAEGLMGVMLQSSHGSMLGWLGRCTQYLGGVYLFTAAMATARDTGGWRISLETVEEAWRSEALPAIRRRPVLWQVLRYGSSLVGIGLAFWLRLLVVPWVGGELPPYITFFPAVMGVALLAGLGPGLVATVLVVLVVDSWILPPLNSSGILAPVHRLSQALFAFMGMAMSGLAALYRRDRERAAKYERETALRESLARLATFAEASFEGIAESEHGKILDCNDQFARMLGYTIEEMKGIDIADLVAPEDRERVMRNIREGRGSAIEHAAIRKDGNCIVVEARGRVVSPEGVRRITAVRDITERKRAEEALRESEERLRLLGDNLPESAIYQYAHEPDGSVRFLYCSAGMERLNGVSARDVLRDPGTLRRQVPSAYYERLVEAEARSARELSDFEMDVPMQRPDGQIRWMRLRYRPRRMPDGRTVWDGVQTDITAHRTMEEALKESEARYRELVQSANSAIIRWRADGTIKFFNEYAQRFFGWSADEVLGKHISMLVPEQESGGADLTGLVQDIVDHPERYENNVNENICRDGRRVWMTWTNRAVRGDRGQVTEILAVGSDITERHRMEEAFRQSEQRLRLFIEHAPVSLAMFDRQMRYIAFSRRWLTDYGLGERDLTGLSHYEVFPEISDRWKDAHQRGLAGEVRGEEEDLFERADGSRQWLRWEVRPWGEPGEEVAGIVIFTEDITALKGAEETRRQYDLFASRSRDIFLFVRRSDGRILEANAAAAQAYGYTLEELCNLTIHDLREPGNQEHVAGQMEEADRRGVLFEAVHRRKDGSTFPVEVSARGADIGSTRCLVSVVRDITERKKAETALRESEESLRASLAEKDVLLKEIHHRVKNNMQVISSLVALQASDSKHADMRAVLQDVTHRVRSMALVHEKLYQSTDLAHIDFAEYVRGLLNYLWRAHGTESSVIRLVLDLEPVSLPVSMAVPCGLVLNELVSNALKHAFRGSDGGEVVVSLRAEPGNQVRLSVRDNGTGLPDGFDWKEARSLGLHLVQMLSGQLHAAVEVSSDRGTQFTVTFEGPEK